MGVMNFKLSNVSKTYSGIHWFTKSTPETQVREFPRVLQGQVINPTHSQLFFSLQHFLSSYQCMSQVQ